MFKRKERSTAATTARGLSRRLYLSGEQLDGAEVPDGCLGVALATREARIVVVDEPEALRHLFELLDAFVVDGSQWRARTVDAAPAMPPTAVTAPPVEPSAI